MAESRATDMIGEIAERGARPGRIRRFFQAVKRNIMQPEPPPTVREDILPAIRLPAIRRRGTVTLPWIQVVMLRRAAGEMLNLAQENRDSFVAIYGDENDQVKHPEEALTLAEIEFEIARAQRAIKDFDRVYPDA